MDTDGHRSELTAKVQPPGTPVYAWPWVGLALMGWLALRLWSAARLQLVPDEAYYWVWSRHLATGYLDHPPMVAYLIRLSTLLLGSTELGVRLPAVVLSFGTITILLLLCRRVSPERRAMGLVAVLLLTSPALVVLGTIITPDTPACFFATCALAFAILAVTSHRSFYSWVGFGLCTGLALLSKYTAILLPVSVFVALATSREGRRHLAQPGFWLGSLVAVGVFWPAIHWNATHGWASFRFQLRHGVGSAAGAPFGTLASYIGGQMAVWTPVVFVLSILVLIGLWRRYRELALPVRVLLLAATTPLVFFALSSLRRAPEINWPIFAYLPLSLLLAMDWGSSAASALTGGRSAGRASRPGREASAGGADAASRTTAGEDTGAPRTLWPRIGVVVALVMTLGVHFLPSLTRISPWHIPKDDELFGWREFGQHMGAIRGQAPVLCNTYQDASELSFYIPGQPEVWSMNLGDTRSNAFDYFAGRPD